MAENMSPTLAQMQQLNRGLTEKMLDRAASAPQWKQQLLDDPEAAMRAANFSETQQLEQMRAGAEEGEVRGQALPGGGAGGEERYCPWQCVWWTQYWHRSW
jgi:hypothetical protein